VIAAVAILSVAVFMAVFWLARIVPTARRAIAVVLEASAALRNPEFGDDVRESMMRRGSLTLLGVFLQIGLRSAVALAAAAIPIYLADWAGVVPRGQVFGFLARVDVIAAVTVTTIIAWFLAARLWRNR